MTATEAAAPPQAPAAGVPLTAVPHGVDPAELAALDGLYAKAWACRGNVPAILELARELGDGAPQPQQGRTHALWQLLATLGCADLGVARIIEPHLDALAILHQAGADQLNQAGSTWGVFAAQGPGTPLEGTLNNGEWHLDGDKPWCSLAGELSHALITAKTESGVQLFAVDLRHPGITASTRPWQALGLPAVPSAGLGFNNVPAVAVGGPNWYLERPGFAWGGVGVAAVWHGAATAVARRLHRHCMARKPDQIALWHLGTTDQALWSAAAAFHAAAQEADAVVGANGGANKDAGWGAGTAGIMAARLRATVVGAAETVLAMAAHGMGPEPLAFEAEHAQRVADLELYLRQDHAERSLAHHGAALASHRAGSPVPPW